MAVWEPSSPLAKWFASQGIFHADDSSACIFKAFRAKLQGKPFDLVQEAEFYKAYWESSKEMEKTLAEGGSVSFRVGKDGNVEFDT